MNTIRRNQSMANHLTNTASMTLLRMRVFTLQNSQVNHTMDRLLIGTK
jgi:hypothetical protein